MTNRERQHHEELAVFLEFAKICAKTRLLPLLPTTARRGPDPPDVLCDLESGNMLAFELVGCEDVTKDDANPDRYVGTEKKLADKMALEKSLRQEYSAALAAGRIDQPSRFEVHSVTVYFEEHTSFKNRRKAAPRIMQLLNQLGPGCHPIRDRIVRSIHCEQDPENLKIQGPPTFHVPSGCGAQPYVVERVLEKIEASKKYDSQFPLHQLAWSTTACDAEAAMWRDSLAQLLLTNGMGLFERIWVFGWHKKAIVFDSAASSAN